MSETKTCKTCLVDKPLTEFYLACRSLKCYQSYCIECFKEKNRKRYVKVPDNQRKKVGRKKIQLTPEQLEIIKLHNGTLADLSRKLNISYETLKYYRRMGKFQMN